MNRFIALECTMDFLGEKCSELYVKYCERASQLKNSLCAKNDLPSQGLPDLERRGA